MWRITSDGYLDPALCLEGISDCQSMPRQMLPLVYWQNGYVDVIRPRAILEKNSMWGDRALPFIVDEPLFELDYPGKYSGYRRGLAPPSGGRADRRQDFAAPFCVKPAKIFGISATKF